VIEHDPDVLVIVELDHYEDLRLILEEDYGYHSVFKKKNKPFYADGTGIFWKSSRFKSGTIYREPLLKKQGSSDDADQIFVAVELSPRNEKCDTSPFVIAGGHLKSTKKEKGEKIRLDQCKQIMDILKKITKFPVIFCADMNAEAKSTRYKALAYPYLRESGFSSAYANVMGKEPEYTSWKFRIDEDPSLFWYKKNKETVTEWKYTIDFIFQSSGLKSRAVLDMPEEKEIDEHIGCPTEDSKCDVSLARKRCLLPNSRCPSDHLCMVAEIELGSPLVVDGKRL